MTPLKSFLQQISWPKVGRDLAGSWSTILTGVALALLLGLVLVARFVDPPVTAVASRSMEPTLNMGDLVSVRGADPWSLRENDVIIFRTTDRQRELYGYPRYIVHRIVNVEYEDGTPVSFQTRGDAATGRDPFSVRTSQVVGTPGEVLPQAGWPLLFLQSSQGLLFLGALGFVILLYSAGSMLERRRVTPNDLARSWVNETLKASPLLERQDRLETGVAETREAVQEFAQAMREYATHLSSHTAAVQALSSAARDSATAAQEQREILKMLAVLLQEKDIGDRGGSAARGPRPASQGPVVTSAVALRHASHLAQPPGVDVAVEAHNIQHAAVRPRQGQGVHAAGAVTGVSPARLSQGGRARGAAAGVSPVRLSQSVKVLRVRAV